MSKDNTIYGIDISKDKLDVYNEKEGHFVVENSPKSFQKLKKKLDKKALVVMESTGYYHYRLAQFYRKKKWKFRW